jgi:hypothetical protein
MSIINRRNAVMGWAVWNLMKQIGKRKASDVVPGRGGHAGLNKPAIASIAAGIGGALFFWRKKSAAAATE